MEETNKTMTKEKVEEAVSTLPQEFDVEELIERLIFIDKVEKGLQQLDRGETKTHEEVKTIAKSWQQ